MDAYGVQVERRVRAATRNEPWGPSGSLLKDLADISHDPEQCCVIFAVLEIRLGQADPIKWRNIYKVQYIMIYLVFVFLSPPSIDGCCLCHTHVRLSWSSSFY